MKVLNDRIELTVNTSGHTSDVYRYDIIRDGTTVFSGTFFLPASTNSYTFDITDIVRSDGWNPKVLKIDYSQTTANRLQNVYTVKVYWSSASTTTSTAETVDMVWTKPNADYTNPYYEQIAANHYTTSLLQSGMYTTQDTRGFGAIKALEEGDIPYIYKRYPQLDTSGMCAWVFVDDSENIDINDLSATQWANIDPSDYILSPSETPFIGQTVTDYVHGTPTPVVILDYSSDVPISGTSVVKYDFISHYPMVYESNCPLILSFWHGDDSDTRIYINAPGSSTYVEGISEPEEYTYTFNTNISFFVDEITLHGVDGELTYTSEHDRKEVKFAHLDSCPKRFYLIWQDRFGSFVSQGFKSFDYSESINRTEGKNYKNQRENYNIQVQPKWKITSDWIPQNQYPYYESIFTSPFLILHDTKLNKNYSVLVKGDYEEKTYKNQKSLINLTLEIELNEKQNIIL